MKLIKFGNTWWGKEWLNAFNNIYNSNRLPRGQGYARNGAVISLSLLPGQIEARVQGSYPRPYKLKITLPLLTFNEQQIIIDTISNNPYYLAQLLSSKLPPELNQDLRDHGVLLFPLSWSDFSGYCSCPDSANPCKHLAAIIYQIANKIDLNPFVIFELKGFTLLQEMNKLYGASKEVKKRNIPTYNDLNQPAPFSIPEPTITAAQIDFSKLKDLNANIFQLLPSKPLFCLTIDYRAVLTRHYRELAKSAICVLDASQAESEFIPATFIIEPLRIGPDLSCDINIYDHNKTREISTIDELIGFIKEIPSLNLNSNSAQLNGLYLIFHLCRALIINGAIIPQIYACGSDNYMIRYIPLLTDDTVYELVFQVAAILPDNLVIFGSTRQAISKLDQCLWLIALFIKKLMEQSKLYADIALLEKTPSRLRQSSIRDHGIEKANLLFISNKVSINIQTEGEFINHISLWLERFTVPKTRFVPLLQVKESNSDFKLDLLIKDFSRPNDAPIALKKMLTNKSAVNEVLYHANLITEYMPALSGVFTSAEAISYSESEFLPLFFEVLPVLKLIGVEVLLPKALKNLLLPKLAIRGENKSGTQNTSYLKLDEMLSFDWQISLGSQHISLADFKKLLANGKKLVKLKDGYAYLDQKLIDNILNSINKPPKIASGAGLLRDLLAGDNGEIPFMLSEGIKQLIGQLLVQEQISRPANLQAKLRDYQYQGYCWLYRNIRLGFGSVIADDMGLGKTLQVISCILKLKQESLIGNSLVIVPTSLLTNWYKELERFAPDLSINIYHGKTRNNLESNDITLITYGTIRRDIEKINQHKWDMLVIDEAQNIKNLSSQQTKLVKSIKSKYRIAMSGTPVENRLLEYYSIIDFTNKGYLGSVSHFNRQFAKPIETERDINQLNKFLNATKPFVLRRLKSDKSIIQDLPEKIVIDEYCDLSKEQVALYQATLDNMMEKLKDASDETLRRGLVLTLIVALKQICNHPSHYLKQFNVVDVESSGKLLLLLDKLKDIHANNEKVLIFTQFAEMGAILQSVIERECNTPVLFLHGAVSRAKRDDMVDLIQNNLHNKTMILSIKAGGVGLNLTGANHVIHYDLWWNPAVENQATDRAYRIGQNKNVFVHRLVCSNSFEEKINKMIKDKQELANLTVATGEQWIGNLSDKELNQIFTLSHV